MKKSAQAPEATARAKFPTAHLKPQDLVNECIKKSDAMKAHPDYPNKPEVQQCTNAMVASAQALDQVAKQIGLLKVQLVALETGARVRFERAGKKHGAVLWTLAAVAAGEAEAGEDEVPY